VLISIGRGDFMSYKIYLVEDDVNLNLVLKTYLEKEGWSVTSFLNGTSAKENISNVPDLWILDIMLPDIDGYQLIKEIKSFNSEVPVIFISARDADIDRVVGLELGSDDYLAKPFLPRELVLRVKKLLDRVNPSINNLGAYTINHASREIKLGDEIIDLTTKEYDLVLYFAKNQDRALSREQILDYIWGEDYFGSDRVVDDLIRRIRRKMTGLNLETIYGYGYKVIKS
jgi:two-component system response regulator CssR